MLDNLLLQQRVLGNRVVQRLLGGAGGAPRGDNLPASHIRRAAAEGLRTPVVPLPHVDQIQRAFGRHDISHVQAHVGAEKSTSTMQASAFTVGQDVVFGPPPDLRTTAHETAHAWQQMNGLQPSDGVGRAGDAYERHADAVAERVVSGGSAEGLLDAMPARSGGRAGPSAAAPAVQRKLEIGGQDITEEQIEKSWSEIEGVIKFWFHVGPTADEGDLGAEGLDHIKGVMMDLARRDEVFEYNNLFNGVRDIISKHSDYGGRISSLSTDAPRSSSTRAMRRATCTGSAPRCCSSPACA
ncbi:Flagellar hook-length control protein FliK [Minicystis rosea]|nr:Flagellar hook-length control protein FliK [Minicystis rosea]